jgi:hypothetical protein
MGEFAQWESSRTVQRRESNWNCTILMTCKASLMNYLHPCQFLHRLVKKYGKYLNFNGFFPPQANLSLAEIKKRFYKCPITRENIQKMISRMTETWSGNSFRSFLVYQVSRSSLISTDKIRFPELISKGRVCAQYTLTFVEKRRIF